MYVNSTFEIPVYIENGLKNGTLIKTGGVVQFAEGQPQAGQIVCWLREVSNDVGQVAPQIIGENSIFNSILSKNSILNLGATLIFGVSTLRQLNQLKNNMNNNFEILGKELSSLEAKIEFRFNTTLNLLESITDYQQIELIAEIKSASELAWSAQLETDSFWRRYRMEQSLSKISSVTEKIVIYSSKRLNDMAIDFSNKDSKSRLIIPNDYINTLKLLRYACVSLYLNAAIYAELGNIHFSQRVLEQNVNRLMSCYLRVGKFFLIGSGPIKYRDINSVKFPREPYAHELSSFEGQLQYMNELLEITLNSYCLTKNPIIDFNTIYPYILESSLSDIISLERLKTWVKIFDSNNLENLNLKEKKTLDLKNEEKEALRIFADLLDGTYEDLERLKGYLKEYQYVLNRNMSIEEYQQMLSININLTSDYVGKTLYMVPNDLMEREYL